VVVSEKKKVNGFRRFSGSHFHRTNNELDEKSLGQRDIKKDSKFSSSSNPEQERLGEKI
jgi:hypothetical protein